MTAFPAILRSSALAVLLCAVTSLQAAPDKPKDAIEVLLAERGITERPSAERVQNDHSAPEHALDRATLVNVSEQASQLVVSAMGFLGLPYKRGGNSFETGFDCSGFVKAIYEQTLGKVLPRSASEQAAHTSKIEKDELQPGDLVFFNTMRRAFSHVGIYIGEGKFIHSPKPGAQVRIEDMGVRYWNTRYNGARRVE